MIHLKKVKSTCFGKNLKGGSVSNFFAFKNKAFPLKVFSLNKEIDCWDYCNPLKQFEKKALNLNGIKF